MVFVVEKEVRSEKIRANDKERIAKFNFLR